MKAEARKLQFGFRTYPYFRKVKVFVIDDIIVGNELIKSYGQDAEDWEHHRACTLNHEKKGIALLFKSSCLTWPVIVHEVQHAVYRILERAGVQYNDGSEEAFTYLSEDIATHIERGLRRIKIPIQISKIRTGQ